MGESPAQAARLLGPVAVRRHYFDLVLQLTKREILGRYKDSVLGLLWTVVQPAIMLATYTFVFGVVFKLRWSDEKETTAEFSMVLFAGLIVFNIFAECIAKAPNLIVSRANLVKQVVFPLQVLPFITLATAVFHATIGGLILLVCLLWLKGSIAWTVILLPVVLGPLLLGSLGMLWFLSSLGVFLRDLDQMTAIFTTLLMFITPIFYPAHMIPADYAQVLQWVNPMLVIVRETRNVAIFGVLPSLPALAICWAVASITALAGYTWFQKTRKGFADVL